MNDTIMRLKLKDREIVLVGTAHVSRESIQEVSDIIRQENPDRVCIELDEGRYNSMTRNEQWENLNIASILKQGKGFLLLANLALSSFQRRLGSGLGVKPGDEMKAAIDCAAELGIPYELCDREVQLTLKRAWGKCNFWSKNKLFATLLSSALTTEKIGEEEIEALKNKNELDGMMAELADYLPSVKETLIDERDRYLAAKIWAADGKRLIAVIGAGHMGGTAEWLQKMAEGQASTETDELEKIPPKTMLGKVAPWIIPALLLGLITAGFFRSGVALSLELIFRWILINGTLSAIGAALAFAHPLSIIVSFLGAPITSMNPFIGIGILSGVTEATVRKPRVKDLEHLSEDITHIKSFYKNRVTRALLVFFLSSVGSSIGTFIALPYLTSLLF